MNTAGKLRGTARLCSHRVRWWYDVSDGTPDFTELPESEEEHIRQLIGENCVEGELCYYDTENDVMYYGWWKIER